MFIRADLLEVQTCLWPLNQIILLIEFFQDNDEDETEENDDYNKIMKALVFEPKKAKAEERLKTDEEMITDQKEMLEKLEDL